MNEDLFGEWYVYRYNSARHVLKAPETKLEIKELNGQEDGHEEEDFGACFELSGLEEKIAVEMIFDPRTESWFGEDGSIDFRLERTENSGIVMLIGHATDRMNAANRDYFLAVRSRREHELPWPPQFPKTYQFGPSYEGFLEKKKRVQIGGGASITVRSVDEKGNADGMITFNGETYPLDKVMLFERGVKFAGWYEEETGYPRKIWLWLLPLDDTNRLLATGYYFGIHQRELREGEEVQSVPTDQRCNKGTHAGG